MVIVEVLSDSTRRTDVTEKREAYLTIPTLKVLLLVETAEPVVSVYRRQSGGGFSQEDYSGLQACIALPEIGLEMAISEIYGQVEFS